MSKPVPIVATFVAGQGAAFDDAALMRALRVAGYENARRAWLADNLAADAFVDSDDIASARAGLEAALAGTRVDVIVQPVAHRRKALLVADMDSTMIEQECIDELAEEAGIRDRISAITERAMAGELAFEAALRERVALLAGVKLDAIEAILSRITLTPGARTLVATMRAHGAHTALVSGGFR